MFNFFQQINMLDFICDYCSRSFTRKYNLLTHIENCHISSSCSCEICGQTLGSPAGLQLHYSRGHNRFDQPNPECDLCGRVFTRKQNIMSHMITVHLQCVSPEIRCKHCDRIFTTERTLKRHINQQHNPNVKYPKCDECNKVFKGKNSLVAHLQSAHGSDRSSIRCEQCDKVYTNNRNLKRHIEMHHGEKEEFRCDICPKVYTSNQSLRRHTRTAHSTDSQYEYKCDYCDKVIVGKENLDSHIQFYHKQENSNSNDVESSEDELNYEFTCENCGKCFIEEPLLRQHVKNDHSFKTFYKYCRESLLKQTEQKLVDSPKKQNLFYNCEFCNNAFTSVYELKDHMKTHHEREYCLSTCNVCFCKFYCKETWMDHKKICIPPENVNFCSHCDKLFTDISSLEFHIKIFHPQAEIADSNITSTNIDDSSEGHHKCEHCDRIYYSDRSLKHHIKLKHTTDEAMECELCGKICNNKYYLASHMKIVHTNDSWSKCDYCDKQFKSKRNIRRHIEYTHLGKQRYKCIECETLFKEKRSLRKHVRTKHPNSAIFPQCHFCYKRFESAKSCKIHLKLLHSFNMNTYPCDLCSVSFTSQEALNIHLQTKHLAEDEIYKCEKCNLVFKGQESFEKHNEITHVNIVPNIKQKVLPRCIICMKDFSTRKTLKRHIKKFHDCFDVNDLANYGSRRRIFNVECVECIKIFSDDVYAKVIDKFKYETDAVIFQCETCCVKYNSLEYSIQRYKMSSLDMNKGKMILSELCTAEMSEEEESFSGFPDDRATMEPESTTSDIRIKLEPIYDYEAERKTEPINENSTENDFNEYSAGIKAEPMSP